MSGLNLANFKKLKEDKKTVTMGHPAGHSITILKSKLSAIQKEQMKRLPIHAAEGDPSVGNEDNGRFIPGAPTPADIQALPELSEDQSRSLQSVLPPKTQIVASNDPTIGLPPENQSYSNSPIKTSVVDPENEPRVSPEEPQAADTSPPPAHSAADKGFSIEGAYAQGQRAIRENQSYSQQLDKNRADIEQQDLDGREQLQIDAKQNLETFKKHKDDFANYIATNPINEKHYVENMGTGQKVATAIGLLLGGFTGGFNRTGVNPAAEWLNGQINRDIEGQKNRMDQQKTILGANQELYHDQVLANNATHVNMNTIYAHKIQMAADKLGTLSAKAAADAALSKLAYDSEQRLNQSAIRGAAAQRIQEGGAGLDPITLGQAGYMTPEEAQKEQASFNVQKAKLASVANLYARANEVQSAGNAFFHPIERAKNIDLINSELADQVVAGDTVHRFTPESAKQFVEPYTIQLSDSPQDVINKHQQLNNKIQQIHAGETPNFSRLAPRALPNYAVLTPDQQAVTVARARLAQNPNDKVAQHALQLNGINTGSVAR